MSTTTTDLNLRLEEVKKELYKTSQEYIDYQLYAEKQKDFQFPKAAISIEPTNDRTEVYMDVEYVGTKFHFESMKPEHLDPFYNYLDNQPAVRQKYADGKTRTLEQTTARVNDLSNRFMHTNEKGEPKEPNLFSGFAVSDAETNSFLGMCVLGGGPKPDISEMAYLNRVEAWSRPPQEIIKTYQLDTTIKKHYTGVATTEVCTLLQYGKLLKDKNYKINGHEFSGEVVMTARTDNPGSWKAGAKGKFEVYDIDSNPNYGPELRYQMRTKI